MCYLPLSTTLISEVAQADVLTALSPAVQYACRYWAAHVSEGNVELKENGNIHRFLKEHLLHWLEAMSLMGKISETIIIVADLAARINVSTYIALRLNRTNQSI